MKYLWLLSLLFILPSCELFRSNLEDVTLSNDIDLNTGEEVASTDWVRGMNLVGWQLMAQYHSEEPAKNVLLSPFSIGAALSMVYNGAKGNTRDQMSAAWQLNDPSIASVNKAYRSLHQSLLTDGPVDMQIANAAFYDPVRLLPNDDFFSNLEESFDLNPITYDFADPGTKDLINQWVLEQTNEKIEKIVEEIKAEDVMFLINAIAIQGDWKLPFDAQQTREEDFWLHDESSIKHPFMFLDEQLFFKKSESVDIVELSLEDSDFVVDFFLANEMDILDWVQGQDARLTESLDQTLQRSRLLLNMPKFTIEYKKQLNDGLKSLGIQDAFEWGVADLSLMGVSPLGPLYLSKVEHKTFLKVDEKGIDGAAVTSAGISAQSLPPRIDLNRPFLIIVRHKPSDTWLFAGIIRNPAEGD